LANQLNHSDGNFERERGKIHSRSDLTLQAKARQREPRVL
jgi:hypothetical protein